MESDIAEIIINELKFRKDELKEINLICYCIMPDHLHLLLSFAESYSKSMENPLRKALVENVDDYPFSEIFYE